MQLIPFLRRRIEMLGPYQSLLLLLVPAATVEPLKLVALFVVGHGHWLGGVGVLAGAYCLSLLCVERLFRIVKPKLLTLPWFFRLWTWLQSTRLWAACKEARKRFDAGVGKFASLFVGGQQNTNASGIKKATPDGT